MGGRPRGRGAGHTVCQGAGGAPSGGHRTARACWAATDAARATLAAADAVLAAGDFAASSHSLACSHLLATSHTR